MGRRASSKRYYETRPPVSQFVLQPSSSSGLRDLELTNTYTGFDAPIMRRSRSPSTQQHGLEVTLRDGLDHDGSPSLPLVEAFLQNNNLSGEPAQGGDSISRRDSGAARRWNSGSRSPDSRALQQADGSEQMPSMWLDGVGAAAATYNQKCK